VLQVDSPPLIPDLMRLSGTEAGSPAAESNNPDKPRLIPG
jgi:hypothetical protein